MLINPTLKTYPPEQEESAVRVQEHIKLHDGVYQIGHWNPELVFAEAIDGYWPFSIAYRNIGFTESLALINTALEDQDLPLTYSSYGVCDNYQQLLDAYPSLTTCSAKFFITMVQMRKIDEPPDGGWRWHKWGPYIGKQEPCCEYLVDEPLIEEVWTFSINKVKE